MAVVQSTTRVYVYGLALAALGMALALMPGTAVPPGQRLLLAASFVALIGLALLFPLKIGFRTNLALDTTVLFAAVLLFDPVVAMGIATGGYLLAHIIRRHDWIEVIFNCSETALQVGVGGYLLRLFEWDPNRLRFDRPLQLPVIIGAALVMYILNTLAVALVIRIQSGEPPLRVLLLGSVRSDFLEHVTQLLVGLVAASMVDSRPWVLPLLILPAVAIYRSLQRQVRLDQQTIERARLYEAEQRARAEAEAAVQSREQFVSIAAHEFKTPLTSLKANGQLLARELRQAEWDRGRIMTITMRLNTQVERFEALIAELLDATRMRQNRLELRPEWTDLTALAHAVVEQFALAEDHRIGHALVFEADGTVRGYWDASRLEQVVTNLVSNALKYSPPGAEVRVTVRDELDGAALIVRDEGIGIPTTDRERLFEPYARSRVVARRIEGMGLGLFISEQIVRRHGGEITVESELGVGSTFSVRLPTVPPGFATAELPCRDGPLATAPPEQSASPDMSHPATASQEIDAAAG
jgi:signal transduction histidine kinase